MAAGGSYKYSLLNSQDADDGPSGSSNNFEDIMLKQQVFCVFRLTSKSVANSERTRRQPRNGGSICNYPEEHELSYRRRIGPTGHVSQNLLKIVEPSECWMIWDKTWNG